MEGAEVDIQFHHEGYMAFPPMIRYIECEIIVTIKEPWFKLKGILDDLGYKHPKKLWYVTCKTNISIGLIETKANNNTMKMIEFELQNGYVTFMWKLKKGVKE